MVNHANRKFAANDKMMVAYLANIMKLSQVFCKFEFLKFLGRKINMQTDYQN